MSMAAYLTDRAYRIGCACCVTSQGHGHRQVRSTQSSMSAKRGGKKAMRRELRNEMSLMLNDHLFGQDPVDPLDQTMEEYYQYLDELYDDSHLRVVEPVVMDEDMAYEMRGYDEWDFL